MSTIELIDIGMRRSPKWLVRISVKTLGISRVILGLENANILSEGKSNVFASKKWLLSMPKELTNKETRFLAQRRRDLVIILEEFMKQYMAFAGVKFARTRFTRATVVSAKHKQLVIAYPKVVDLRSYPNSIVQQHQQKF